MFESAKLSLKRKVPSYQRKFPDWITNQEKHKVWFQKRGQAAGTTVASSRSPAEAPRLTVSRSNQSRLLQRATSTSVHLHRYTYKWRYDYFSQIQKHRVSFTRRSQGSYFKFAIQLKQHSNLNRFEMWSGSRRDNCGADFHPFPKMKLNIVISYLSVACDLQKKGGLGSQVYRDQH